MEGTDEGIFSWFTVNFLLERFNTHNPGNTVAALDLGGGSTQVTFSPNPEQVQAQQITRKIIKISYTCKLYDGIQRIRKREILLNEWNLPSNFLVLIDEN